MQATTTKTAPLIQGEGHKPLNKRQRPSADRNHAWRFVRGIEFAIVVDALTIDLNELCNDDVDVDVDVDAPAGNLRYHFRRLAILDTFTVDIILTHTRGFLINTFIFLLYFIFGWSKFLYESQLRLRRAYPP